MRIKRKFKKFLAVQPVFMPFLFNHDQRMKSIAGIHNHFFFSNLGEFFGDLLKIFSALFWMPYSLFLSVQFIRRNSLFMRSISGKPKFIQFLEQVILANVNFIHPKNYYYFGMWRSEFRRLKKYYFFDGNARNLFEVINRGIDLQLLDDKVVFHDFCMKTHLPTPAILGIFDKGIMKNFGQNSIPEMDVFFKPKSGYNTRGIERWDYLGNGMFRNVPAGQILTNDHLKEKFIRKSKRSTYFIQPRLQNHPYFKTIGSDALCTVRIITAYDENGSIQIFHPVLNIPVGNEIFNHMADGGISVCIDPETGVFTNAYQFKVKGCPMPVNIGQSPELQSVFSIPDWKMMKEIAIKAHRLIPEIAIIGWDMAITNHGIVILEGNHNISLNFHQLPPNRPFGKTAFADIVLYHLKRSTNIID